MARGLTGPRVGVESQVSNLQSRNKCVGKQDRSLNSSTKAITRAASKDKTMEAAPLTKPPRSAGGRTNCGTAVRTEG